MRMANMTVAEITELLDQAELPEAILAELHTDRRVSVIRLLEKWQKRKASLTKEAARLQQLFLPEQELRRQGYECIVGVDEAGRGPLAGPLVVGAAILPFGCNLPSLNDSKKLSAAQRAVLYDEIKKKALSTKTVIVEVADIDRLNIYQATVQAMYQAVKTIELKPQAALIDAVPLPELPIPANSLIGGDGLSASIAAASILAKVERDRLMEELALIYPQYGFQNHKGYGTREHLRALAEYGPCPIHRTSFEPIKSWGGRQDAS